MKLYILWTLALLIGLITSGKLTAATSESQIKKPKLWKVSLESTINTDLKELNDKDKTYSTDLESVYSYSFKNGIKLSKKISLSKDLTGERSQSLNNGSISVSKSLVTLNNNTSISGRLRVTLPYNKDARTKDKFLTAFDARATLISNLAAMDLKRTTFIFLLQAKENLYAYEQKVDGRYNTQRSYMAVGMFSQAIGNKTNLAASLANIWAFDYKGERKDNIYSADIEVSVDTTANSSVALGISTLGKTYDQYGSSLDINIYDKNSTGFYFTGTYIF